MQCQFNYVKNPRLDGRKTGFKRMLQVSVLLFSVAIWTSTARAETVDVKYRGPVSLDTFDCPKLKESSVVNRICYDGAKAYLIVQLKNTYYHYCDVPQSVFSEWVSASSLGKFYNSFLKGGPYGCQDKIVPQY